MLLSHPLLAPHLRICSKRESLTGTVWRFEIAASDKQPTEQALSVKSPGNRFSDDLVAIHLHISVVLSNSLYFLIKWGREDSLDQRIRGAPLFTVSISIALIGFISRVERGGAFFFSI
jgi:hypothetical protein